MADPWIRMRVALAQDPTVLSLGLSLGPSAGIPPDVPRRVRRRLAVALLLETWGLFHVEADATGLLPSYSLADIDEHVAVDGWAQALVDVGWLIVSPSGVTAYAFTDWIGSKKENQSKERERKRAKRACPTEVRRNSEGSPADSSPSLSDSDSGSLSSEGEPEREPRAKPTALARAVRKCLTPPAPRVLEAAKAWDEHAREKGNPMSERAWMIQLANAEKDPNGWVEYVKENLTANTNRLQKPPNRGGTNGRPRPHSSQDAFRANLADLEQHIADAFPDNPTPRITP